MRTVQYYKIQDGILNQIEEQEAVLIWDGIDIQALTLEVWPQDLRLRPCKSVPLKKEKYEQEESRVEQIIRLNREENERSDQGVLVRFYKARSPYDEEFTKRDDARNRAYLSPKVSKRRKKGQIPPPEIETPF